MIMSCGCGGSVMGQSC